MHTTCSDGVYTPEQLTKMAVDAGLDVIAISDHDTVAAYDGSHELNPGVRIIRAIEISSECDGEDVHILGYGIDTTDEAMLSYCREFKQRRFDRAMEIVDRCLENGYEIDRKVVEDMVHKGGTVGRPPYCPHARRKGVFPRCKDGLR